MSLTKNQIQLLNEVAEDAKTCTNCPLYRTRRNVVTGWFPKTMQPILFVTESPSEMEDLVGSPLPGAFGKLFTQTIYKYLNLTRDNYGITLCAKCAPVYGTIRERANEDTLFWCSEYLYRQIEIVQPELIIAVGGVPFKILQKKKMNYKFKNGYAYSIADKIGKLFLCESILSKNKFYVVPIYHPFSWDKKIQYDATIKGLEFIRTILNGEYPKKDCQYILAGNGNLRESIE